MSWFEKNKYNNMHGAKVKILNVMFRKMCKGWLQLLCVFYVKTWVMCCQ